MPVVDKQQFQDEFLKKLHFSPIEFFGSLDSIHQYCSFMNHEDYSDRYLREILLDVRSIAMVGASTTWSRPSYFVMKYLKQKGYRVIPVNPRSAGQELLGETVCSGLDSLPEQVDMVDMFRPAEEATELVRQAIRLEAKVFWMQL